MKSREDKKVDPSEYSQLFNEISSRINQTKYAVSKKLTQEIIRLYFDIGEILSLKYEQQKWGDSYLSKLAQDLKQFSPNSRGFSKETLTRIRRFYNMYKEIVLSSDDYLNLPIFSVPWGHNILIMTKLENLDEKLWYAQKTIENAWSRSRLEFWIESQLYHREGKAISNFHQTLPEKISSNAHESLRDPLILDFLELPKPALENDIEKGLVEHIQRFLLELGSGFAFIGSQYPLEIEGEQYFLDLLFYNIEWRSYVVIELKNTEFQPEHVGKMNFYLSVVDEKIKKEEDSPSIGFILCRSKSGIKIKHSLRHTKAPMTILSFITEIEKSLEDELAYHQNFQLTFNNE